MNAVYALGIVLSLFAIGEVFASKTKAVLSQVFVVAVCLLAYYWLGLPKTLISDTGFKPLGFTLTGMFLAGVGTTINFKELARQWKTLVISVGSMSVGVFAIIIIGSFIIGEEQAIAGAPVYAGSLAAVMIMSQKLTALGMDQMAAFCVMLLSLQAFVGLPLSSLALRKEAKTFLKSSDNVKKYAVTAAESGVQQKKWIHLPSEYSTSGMILAKLALTSCLGVFLSKMMNGAVHSLVITLLLGIVFTEIGFLDSQSLPKSDSQKIIMLMTIIVVFEDLGSIRPQDFLNMLFPLAVILGIGVCFTAITACLLARLMNFSPYLAMAMGFTCMYGFPTTMYIPQEVAAAYGTTEEEVNALTNYMVPKVVTAGIATVSIASVLISGFVAGLL